MHGPVPDFQQNIMSALRIRRNVLISSAVFLGALAVALVPGVFDRPLTELINSFVGRSALFDSLVAALATFPTFSGAILAALIWSCWFGSEDLESRARILVGTLAASGTGMLSRLSQHAFSTHPRPIHDPSIHFQAPGGYVEAYNTWDSFPSDHVAVLAGLVVVIYIARSRFAIFAIIWIALVEPARIYTGAHYPSDLIGGAALAAVVVWVAQASWPISLGGRVVKWEQSSPSLFYMSAFFLTYQVATLFGDIRFTFSPLIRHLLSS